jgi:hypothetical protein
MRPPIMLTQIQAASLDDERHRGEERRHAHHRSLLELQGERSSLAARLGAGLMRRVRRDRHSLTTYPCRLPNGKIGRTAVVLRGGEWTLTCSVA